MPCPSPRLSEDPKKGSPFIADSKVSATDRKRAATGAQERTVGHLLYLLGDLGVCADTTAERTISAGWSFEVHYGSDGFLVVAKQSVKITGVVLTPLGESLASFYDPVSDITGLNILRDWLDSLTTSGAADVLPIQQPPK